MAAIDVADLVGQHRLKLLGRAQLPHHAGIDEDVPPAGDEGVQPPVGEDVDVHRVRRHAGAAQHRFGQHAQGALDLGIAHQRLRQRPARGQRQAKPCRRRGRQSGHAAPGRAGLSVGHPRPLAMVDLPRCVPHRGRPKVR
ncbi:MAG: hypothetical protein D6686_00195 [Alphaproteobacteria bacterium]|nr:MAG: hypothetical protein D6686_00195 [Alphaproteobacteria bacterium]